MSSHIAGLILAGLIVAAFLGAFVFLVLYVNVANWRTSALGRHTFWLSLTLATLTGLAVLSLFLRDYPGRVYVRLGSWAFLAFVLWQRVWLLLVAFRAGPLERHRAAAVANEEDTNRLVTEEEKA